MCSNQGLATCSSNGGPPLSSIASVCGDPGTSSPLPPRATPGPSVALLPSVVTVPWPAWEPVAEPAGAPHAGASPLGHGVAAAPPPTPVRAAASLGRPRGGRAQRRRRQKTPQQATGRAPLPQVPARREGPRKDGRTAPPAREALHAAIAGAVAPGGAAAAMAPCAELACAAAPAAAPRRRRSPTSAGLAAAAAAAAHPARRNRSPALAAAAAAAAVAVAAVAAAGGVAPP
eukprot:352672-Chlamydomonas_euryale.AAC.7